MAFEIIWTRQAEKDYDKIINYIAENWGDKEIRDFFGETERFLRYCRIILKFYKGPPTTKAYTVDRSIGLQF